MIAGGRGKAEDAEISSGRQRGRGDNETGSNCPKHFFGFGFVNSARNCFCLSLLGPTEPRRAKVLGQLYAFSGKAGLAALVPDSQKGS